MKEAVSGHTSVLLAAVCDFAGAEGQNHLPRFIPVVGSVMKRSEAVKLLTQQRLAVRISVSL